MTAVINSRHLTNPSTLISMQVLTGKRKRGRSEKSLFIERNRSISDDGSQAQASTPLRTEYHQKEELCASNTQSYQPRLTRRNFFHVFRSWWLELLTCVLAFIILLAFIITLWKQENKPLQTYTLGITINSLTTIYTIILKALCVFVVTEGA